MRCSSSVSLPKLWSTADPTNVRSRPTRYPNSATTAATSALSSAPTPTVAGVSENARCKLHTSSRMGSELEKVPSGTFR